MSEVAPSSRADAEAELALAGKWLAAGDVSHAAVHVAQAIAADPSLDAAYDELERVYAAGDRSEDLFAVTEGAYIGMIAARAHLCARSGDLDKALVYVGLAVINEPAKPWTATVWWPDLTTSLAPRKASMALAELAPQLARADREATAPFLNLARDIIEQHPADIELAVRLSGVALALGAEDEGRQWCDRAEALTAGPLGAIMLGFALRDAKRYAEMEAAWKRAIDADPDNLDVHVDLAQALIERNRRGDGVRWLQRALDRDPAHVRARALRRRLRFHDTDDPAHLVALVDESGGDGAALAILAAACATKTWLNRVPMPEEAAAVMAKSVANERARGKDISVTRWATTAIEPPSAVAATRKLLPGVHLQVLACPEPDLRVPLREGTYRVWRYDGGTVPVPAMARPSPRAAALLPVVANLAWTDPISAYANAAQFAGTPLADLLGLLCHMPAAPDNPRWRFLVDDNPSYWPRLAAAWVCLGVLHHDPDEPWLASTRRAVLVDLVFGVEDWTTDSALGALVVAAWMFPDTRLDVLGIVRARFNAARQTADRRVMTIAASIAQLMLITPGVGPWEAKQARHLIAAADNPRNRRWRRFFRRRFFPRRAR